MARGQRRLRRNYNRVSASAEEDAAEGNEVFVDEDNDTAEDQGGDIEAPAPPARRGIRGRLRQYRTVRTDVEEDEKAPADTDEEDEDLDDDDDGGDDTDEEEEGTKVTIVILDPAQKKFHIPAYTHWTIAKFKEKGERVHKVAPASQRLVYRGQLLKDDKTLDDLGLNTDKLIVHLFPKPRVVIQQGSQASGAAADSAEDEESGGAHIPQIVLNPDEAEQRAHILVLGSADFLEAQNNVKLFSFLLLVISSIELFNLLLILMGVPPDTDTGNNAYSSEDDFFSRHDAYNSSLSDGPYDPYGANNLQQDPYQEAAIQREMQTWHPRNNVDFVISAFGVYVALLGIRATNETTLRLARRYLAGTFLVGIAWMAFNYWFTVHVDQEFDELRREERHNRTGANSTLHNGTDPVIYDDDAIPYKTDYEYYQQNLSLMMIPGMVWMLCCVRAWQFQSLLEEAEREAEERIRNELAQHTATVSANVNGSNTTDADGDAGQDEEGGRAAPAGEGSTDLELQNTSAVAT